MNPNIKLMQPSNDQYLHHSGDPNVAMSNQSKELFDNKKIFDSIMGKQIKDYRFIAIVVKELKQRFEKEFSKYKQNANQVTAVNPEIIKVHLKKTLDEYFKSLKEKVIEMQKSVMI